LRQLRLADFGVSKQANRICLVRLQMVPTIFNMPLSYFQDAVVPHFDKGGRGI
jgi:hypothetical protein